MATFQEKRKIRNFFESVPFLAVLAVLTILLGWSVIGFVSKAEETAEKREIAEKKVEELREYEKKLSFDTEKLDTAEGKEAAIRDKFGLAKEGEGIIIVVEDKNKPNTEDTSQNSSGMLNFFKNIFR